MNPDLVAGLAVLIPVVAAGIVAIMRAWQGR